VCVCVCVCVCVIVRQLPSVMNKRDDKSVCLFVCLYGVSGWVLSETHLFLEIAKFTYNSDVGKTEHGLSHGMPKPAPSDQAFRWTERAIVHYA